MVVCFGSWLLCIEHVVGLLVMIRVLLEGDALKILIIIKPK